MLDRGRYSDRLNCSKIAFVDVEILNHGNAELIIKSN